MVISVKTVCDLTKIKSPNSLTRCCGLTIFKQFFKVYKNIFRHTQKCSDSGFRLYSYKFLLDNYIKIINFTFNKIYSHRLTQFRPLRKMKYNILKPIIKYNLDFNITPRFSLTPFAHRTSRNSLTSMYKDIDINNLLPLTHVWKKLGWRYNLTAVTMFNHFSGLTLSADKCPAFPSATR